MRSARLAVALLAAAFVSTAQAQDAAPVDPLAPLKDAMTDQDRLVDAGKAEEAVTVARERAKDGQSESYYLLGRALGNVAVKHIEADRVQDAQRLLDEAAAAFDRSQEAGGLTYAPSYLGRARVARFRCLIGVRRVARADPNDRQPFIDAAMHDLDQAIKEYRAALQVAKAWKEALLELVEALTKRGLPGEAEFALHEFLKTRPKDAEARLILGILKSQRGRFAEAETEFRTVLSSDASNAAARKYLAEVLMGQEKFTESAEHWEIVRKQSPRDDEAYLKLFHVYRELKMKDEALAVLADAVRDVPGTEAARRAKALLDELANDPGAWDAHNEDSAQDLVERLKSPDPVVVQKTLEKMRSYKWPALPAAVYRLLVRQDDVETEAQRKTHAAQRLAAVRLILDLADKQTLTILEILLAHPREREADADVRDEVAHAISRLPTDAIVPILFDALGDGDPDVREWAVQGIAARTGKYFRPDLAVRSTDATWPEELASLRRWWQSTSASEAKRSAAAALSAIYGHVEQGSKARVARYALPALDDPSENTWRAGYELFRMLTAETLGWPAKPANAEERKRFADEARAWLEAQTKGGR